MTDHAHEFDCLDCGEHVFRPVKLAANDVDICATCLWLRDISDPVERARFRVFLQKCPWTGDDNA